MKHSEENSYLTAIVGLHFNQTITILLWKHVPYAYEMCTFFEEDEPHHLVPVVDSIQKVVHDYVIRMSLCHAEY